MSRPVELRPISNEEGKRLLRMVRRGAGKVVAWRRAQIVLWAAQGYPVGRIAEIGFTSEDRVREVIHTFNRGGCVNPFEFAGGVRFDVRAAGWLRYLERKLSMPDDERRLPEFS